MNIREITKLSPDYYEISREERNYVSILFAALSHADNTAKFLKYLGHEEPTGAGFGIYFEYAYLRDLWYKIADEETKKAIIREHLRIEGIDEILSMPIIKINTKFGVGGQPSKDHIQYPGKWSILKYNRNFKNEDFFKVCRFKWSFNIKPDMVIHLDKDHAICIEAKYQSGQSSYPSSDAEKVIFQNRKIKSIGQLPLQKYMLQELLGVDTEFVIISAKKEKSDTHKNISWTEAFSSIDTSGLPLYATEMIKRITI